MVRYLVISRISFFREMVSPCCTISRIMRLRRSASPSSSRRLVSTNLKVPSVVSGACALAAAAAPGLVYGVISPLFLIWAGFLCLDKDRLRRRYRAFAGLRTWHLVAFSVFIWLSMFIVAGIANIAR